MEWYFVILLFFVLLMTFIFAGFPIAFAFFTVNIIVVGVFIGLDSGMKTLINSSYDSLAKFSLTPIPLFVLMGEVLFQAGLVKILLDGISKLLGKVPARLSVLTIGTGTVLSAMSGSAVADAAMLGSTLAPEMQKKNYHLKMIVGPIVASGLLAVIIPPTTLGILLASTAKISVGDVLIAGIIPGSIMALMILAYYFTKGITNPELAPKYDTTNISVREKMKAFLFEILPVATLIIFVLGLMLMGIVTPTESAATGALGALVIAAVFKNLNFKVIKNALIGTAHTSIMILLIIAASAGFSQILSYTGATRGMVEFVIGWDIAPILTVIFMLLIVLILGTFIEPISIMMITVPLFYPIIDAISYDPILFAILMLICLALGNITPPFGLLLFVMKGVLPKGTKTVEIYKAVVPVIGICILLVIVLMVFPNITLWLPSLSQ